MDEGPTKKKKRQDCYLENEYEGNEPKEEEEEKLDQKLEQKPLATERHIAITTEKQVISDLHIRRARENPAVEKVFNSLSSPLSEIIDYLPHMQWPHVRRVNKFTNSIVEKKLKKRKISDGGINSPSDISRNTKHQIPVPLTAISVMSLEVTAERKIFSACVPALEQIISFLPHSEWLHIRCVNKIVKRFVDMKLLSVKTFPWVPKKADENCLHKAFNCVQNMTPNLEELPPFVEDRILLGGFTNVRRLTIRPERVKIFGIKAYVREIQKRAPVLEYLELQYDGTKMSRHLTRHIFERRCRFDSLREFNFSPVYNKPEFLNELYLRLNDMAPNLEQLPRFLVNCMHLGRFSKLRRLTIHPESYQYIRSSEIVNHASSLESLNFETGIQGLILGVFQAGFCFESLRELLMSHVQVGDSIFPEDVVSSLPALETLSFPDYYIAGFARDFEMVAALPNLKILERCTERGEQAPPFPPIPSLESVSFTSGYPNGGIEFDWKIFFVGSVKLRKIIANGYSASRYLIATLNRITSRLKELQLRNIDFHENLISESKCLHSLESFEFKPAIKSPIQNFVRAMNVHLPNLKAAKFDLHIDGDVTQSFCNETPTVFPFLLEIPCLNELSIRIYMWSPKTLNVRLQISETLKRNLRGFEFSVRKFGNNYIGIYRSVSQLLDGCVSLERITLAGWNEEEVKEFKENVAVLQLPKLKDITVHWSL